MGANSAVFTFGSVQLVQLYDGCVQLEPAHAYFGTNIDETSFAAACAALGTPSASVAFPSTVSLLLFADRTILIDAGYGVSARPECGWLLESMAHAGIDPGSVTDLVITHGHRDHIGGLFDKDGSPVFPRAHHIVPTLEMADPKVDAELAGLETGADRPLGRVELPYTLAPGVTLVDASGHTPGHANVLVETGASTLLIASDLAAHPVWGFAHPDWHMCYDADPIEAAEARMRWLQKAADGAWVFAGYHMPFPAVGRVERAKSGFRYVPLETV